MALHWRAWVVAVSCSFGLACSDDGLPQEGTAETGSTSGNNTDNPTTASGSGTSVTGPSTTSVPTSSDSDTAESSTSVETGSTSGDTEVTGTSANTDSDTDATGSSSTGDTESASSSGTTGDAEHYEGTFEGTCEALGSDVAGTVEVDIFGDGTVSGTFDSDVDSGTFDGSVDGMGAIEASGSGMLSGDCTFDGQIEMSGDISGVWECPDFQCTGTWEASPA